MLLIYYSALAFAIGYLVILAALNAIPHVRVKSLGWLSLCHVTVTLPQADIKIKRVRLGLSFSRGCDSVMKFFKLNLSGIDITVKEGGKLHTKKYSECAPPLLFADAVSFRILARMYNIMLKYRLINQFAVQFTGIRARHAQWQRHLAMELEYAQVLANYTYDGKVKLSVGLDYAQLEDTEARKTVPILRNTEFVVSLDAVTSVHPGEQNHVHVTLDHYKFALSVGKLSVPMGYAEKVKMVDDRNNSDHPSDNQSEIQIDKQTEHENHTKDNHTENDDNTENEIDLESSFIHLADLVQKIEPFVTGFVDSFISVDINIDEFSLTHRANEVKMANLTIKFLHEDRTESTNPVGFRVFLTALTVHDDEYKTFELPLASIKATTDPHTLMRAIEDMFRGEHNAENHVNWEVKGVVTNPTVHLYYDQLVAAIRAPKLARARHGPRMDPMLVINKLRMFLMRFGVVDIFFKIHMPKLGTDVKLFLRGSLENWLVTCSVLSLIHRFFTRDFHKVAKQKRRLGTFIKLQGVKFNALGNTLHIPNVALFLSYNVDAHSVSVKVSSKLIKAASVNDAIFLLIRKFRNMHNMRYNARFDALSKERGNDQKNQDSHKELDRRLEKEEGLDGGESIEKDLPPLDLFAVLPPWLAQVRVHFETVEADLLCKDHLPSQKVMDPHTNEEIDLGDYRRGVFVRVSEIDASYLRPKENIAISVRSASCYTVSECPSEYVDDFDEITTLRTPRDELEDSDMSSVFLDASVDSVMHEDMPSATGGDFRRLKRVFQTHNVDVHNTAAHPNQLELRVPEVDARIDIFFVWCVMYAMTLVHTFEPDVAKKCTHQEMRRLSGGNSHTVALNVHVESTNVVLRLPNTVDIMLELDDLKVSDVAANKTGAARYIRLYVVHPATKLWTRLVVIDRPTVELVLARPIHESRFVVSANIMRLNVPHQFLFYTVIDNIINLVKAIRQIKHNFANMHDHTFTFDKLWPDEKPAILLPEIRVRAKCFGLCLENDPFQDELAVIFELGRIEQRMRLLQARLFDEEAKRIIENADPDIEDQIQLSETPVSRTRHKGHHWAHDGIGRIFSKHDRSESKMKHDEDSKKGDFKAKTIMEGICESIGGKPDNASKSRKLKSKTSNDLKSKTSNELRSKTSNESSAMVSNDSTDSTSDSLPDSLGESFGESVDTPSSPHLEHRPKHQSPLRKLADHESVDYKQQPSPIEGLVPVLLKIAEVAGSKVDEKDKGKNNANKNGELRSSEPKRTASGETKRTRSGSESKRTRSESESKWSGLGFGESNRTRSGSDSKWSGVGSGESKWSGSGFGSSTPRLSHQQAVEYVEEARERLMQNFSTTWVRKHRLFVAARKARWRKRLENVWGEDEVSAVTKRKYRILGYQFGPSLMAANITGLDITLRSAQIPDVDDFLSRHGRSQPKLVYLILVPLAFELQAQRVYVLLRDYPLPFVSFPANTGGAPCLTLRGDLVVNEKLVTRKEEMRYIFVPFSPAIMRVSTVPDNFYSVHVPRTLTPVKFTAEVRGSIVSDRACTVTWNKAYQPALLEMSAAFDNFTKPEVDDSPLGWWDKLSLILHGNVSIDVPHEICLHIKSSLDPYSTAGRSAGFLFSWQNNVHIGINETGDSRELVRVASDDFVLAVPNYSAGERGAWGLFYDDAEGVNSTSGVEHRKFHKRVVKLSSADKVVWLFGMQFERNKHPNRPLADTEERTLQFQNHWDVVVTNPAFEWHPDSYRDFRSDYIHMQLLVISKASDGREAINAGYLTPLTFNYFFYWWDTLKNTASPPVRLGPLFNTQRVKKGSIKTGTHLFTVKYMLVFEPLTILHMYLHNTDDKVNGHTRVAFTGLKGKFASCAIFLRQRKEYVTYVNERLGIHNRVYHLKMNEADVNADSVDLRVVNALFPDRCPIGLLMVSYERGSPGDTDDNDAALTNSVEFGKFVNTDDVHDGDMSWVDLEDLSELQFHNVLLLNPIVSIYPFCYLPNFTYIREFNLHKEGPYPFGYERFGHYEMDVPDPEAKQVGFLKHRIYLIEHEISRLRARMASAHGAEHAELMDSVRLEEKKLEVVELIWENMCGSDISSESSVSASVRTEKRYSRSLSRYSRREERAEREKEEKGEDYGEEEENVQESDEENERGRDMHRLAGNELKIEEKDIPMQNGNGTPNEIPNDIPNNIPTDPNDPKYVQNDMLNDTANGTPNETPNGKNEPILEPIHGTALHDSTEPPKRNMSSPTDFHNRFIVHNIQLKWDNDLRDHFLTYIQRVGDRKTHVHFMTRHAVQLVESVLNASDNEEAQPLKEQLLNDCKNCEEVINSFDTEISKIDADQEAVPKYLVKLVHPQIQMRTKKDLDTSMLVTSRDLELRILLVTVPGLGAIISESAQMSGLIESRYGVLFRDSHVFVFHREDSKRVHPDLQYGEVEPHWPPWVECEVWYDSSWAADQLIVERNTMAFVYKKPNMLFSEKKAVHQGNEIKTHISKIVVNTDSRQYSALYYMVTDLLIHSKTQRDEALERLYKVVSLLDRSDFAGLNVRVAALQNFIRSVKHLLLQLRQRGRDLTKADADFLQSLDFERQKKELELDIIMRGVLLRSSKNKLEKHEARFWSIMADQLIWHVLNDEREPLVDLAMAHARLTRVDAMDGLNYNEAEVMMMQGFNLQPNVRYPELLRPLEATNDAVVRVLWRMLEPVGGIPIIQEAQLSVLPLKVALDYDTAKKMSHFLFPDAVPDPSDDDVESDHDDSSGRESIDSSNLEERFVLHISLLKKKNPFRKMMHRKRADSVSSSLSPKSEHALSIVSSPESGGSSHHSHSSHSKTWAHKKKTKSTKVAEQYLADDLAVIMSRSKQFMSIVDMKVNPFKLYVSFHAPGGLHVLNVHDVDIHIPLLHYTNKFWSGEEFFLSVKKDLIKIILLHTGKILGNKLIHRAHKLGKDLLKQISDYSEFMSLQDLQHDGRARDAGRSDFNAKGKAHLHHVKHKHKKKGTDRHVSAEYFESVEASEEEDEVSLE